MSFWVGAFAALAVWHLIEVIFSLLNYGSDIEITKLYVLIEIFFMVIFMAASWFLATF